MYSKLGGELFQNTATQLWSLNFEEYFIRLKELEHVNVHADLPITLVQNI